MTAETIAVIIISLVAMASCATLYAVTMVKGLAKFEKSEEANRDLLRHAIVMLKAKDVEEGVKAETARKSDDLQLKALEDTLSENESEAEKEETMMEPVWVRTQDGDTIDMREWEIV